MKEGENMENNVVERPIDNLGRVVLPIGHRKELDLNRGDKVTVTLTKDEILIKKSYKQTQ